MIGAIIPAGFGAFSAVWRVITRGFGIGAASPTPADRIFYVLAENRTFAVSEQRVFYVPLENRSFAL